MDYSVSQDFAKLFVIGDNKFSGLLLYPGMYKTPSLFDVLAVSTMSIFQFVLFLYFS